MITPRLSPTPSPAVAGILAGLVLVLAGCGIRPGAGGGDAIAATAPASLPTAKVTTASIVQTKKPPDNLVPAGYHGRFRTPAMVIQAPGQRPQFCHIVPASLPPACGGPDIVGWSWKTVKSESYAGTRWGSFVLVGTFDGKTFTLTQPAVADDGTLKRPETDSDATTPCPKPAGGWRPTDPAKATNSAFEAVSALAREQSGFGQIWLDQPSVNGRPGNNNPRRFILNVGTTGDVAKVEGRLREVWGGSLCVSKVPRTEAQIYALQATLDVLPGMVTSGPDIRAGQVVVNLRVATMAKQRELDDRFGEGSVRLRGLLVPID